MARKRRRVDVSLGGGGGTMKIEGRAWKLGDHVDTDLIIPARFLNISDMKEVSKYCFADLWADFSQRVRPGDMVIAGDNFGCGSSREQAPWALKLAGVGAIVAKSFARIFYRNAFNIGLPILESPTAPEGIEADQIVSVDFSTGEIMNRSKETRFQAKPVPPFMRSIIDAGGLIAWVKKTSPQRQRA